jgi:hypothetical protein
MSTLTFEARVGADHLVHVPEEIPIGSLVRIQVEPLPDQVPADDYRPRTEIGRRALAARKAYIEAGGKPLGADEISAEVQSRRGGVPDE